MWNTFFRDSLLNELTDFYSSGADQIRHSYPGVRFYNDNDSLTMRAEVPGVHPENIDIEIKDNKLTLTIEQASKNDSTEPNDKTDESKSEASKNDSAKTIRNERQHGKFTRSFELPFKVNADQVVADYRLGVLTVQLPKAEAEKPRKVTVG